MLIVRPVTEACICKKPMLLFQRCYNNTYTIGKSSKLYYIGLQFTHLSTYACTAGLEPLKEKSDISVASAEQGMAAAEGSLAEGSPAEQDSPALGGSLGAAVGTPAAAVAEQVGIPAV